jgi:hypothetical protein
MAGGEGGWRRGYLFELCWLVLSFIVRLLWFRLQPPDCFFFSVVHCP